MTNNIVQSATVFGTADDIAAGVVFVVCTGLSIDQKTTIGAGSIVEIRVRETFEERRVDIRSPNLEILVFPFHEGCSEGLSTMITSVPVSMSKESDHDCLPSIRTLNEAHDQETEGKPVRKTNNNRFCILSVLPHKFDQAGFEYLSQLDEGVHVPDLPLAIQMTQVVVRVSRDLKSTEDSTPVFSGCTIVLHDGLGYVRSCEHPQPISVLRELPRESRVKQSGLSRLVLRRGSPSIVARGGSHLVGVVVECCVGDRLREEGTQQLKPESFGFICKASKVEPLIHFHLFVAGSDQAGSILRITNESLFCLFLGLQSKGGKSTKGHCLLGSHLGQ